MRDLENYEPVADRIAAFWKKYENGRLHTEIVLINDNEVVIKASAYTDRDDPRPAAVDFAQESRTSGPLVKFSVENCATSALGRCLATLNFQPKKDGKAVRPSREEMTKVAATKQADQVKPDRNWSSEATVLAGTKDVDGLRKLYLEAKWHGADADLLKTIQAMAKAIED